MSALHKDVLKSKLPPVQPSGAGKHTGFARKRDYTPTKWDKYFSAYEDVKLDDDNVFRVYRTGSLGPMLLLLHGGGYCGLTWATLTASITDMVECQVAAVDLRGHGATCTSNDEDLSAQVLSSDVGNVIRVMFGDTPPEIIMIGHSMGGAVAVHTAYRNLIPSLIGLAVIDVVEGTAMDALQSMQTFLRSRPNTFKNLETAIEWCVRSGQTRNLESAKVSMPGQVKNSVTNKPATTDLDDNVFPSTSSSSDESPAVVERGNVIREEQEEEDENDEKKDEEKHTEPLAHGDGHHDETAAKESTSRHSGFAVPALPVSGIKYGWRIDLSKTECFWPGWFEGLSNMFLSCNVPKMLLLAGVDRLDKDLTIGQMQGKFQMQVLPQCGHAVHEDVPDKVAEVLATFMVRHKFVQPTSNFHPTMPAC